MRHSHKFLTDRLESISVATTESTALPQRLGYWRDVMAGIFNTTVQIEARPTESLDAKTVRCIWGPVQLVEMTATPHTIKMAAGPDQDSIFVLITLEGRQRVIQEEQETTLDAGSFCICDGARPRAIHFTQHTRSVMLIAPGKRLRETFTDWPQIIATEISGKQGAPAIFYELIVASCRHRNDLGEEAAAEAGNAILSALAATLRSLPQFHATPSSQMETYHKERIRNFVNAHLRDPNLSIESVAREVGLSTRYVHRLFATEAMPLMKWVWLERLDQCCRDLSLHSLRNRSVSEIAFYWGFNNPAHFSRAFRNRFGRSPSDHRQQARRSIAITVPTADGGATVVALNRHSRRAPE